MAGEMFRTLIVGPAAVLIGAALAFVFGIAGGLVVGACLLVWPLALVIDGVTRRLPRRDSMLH